MLLTSGGELRLTSFGKAALPGDEPDIGSLLPHLVTRYASPEVVEGLRCDHRSDLFSLGATLIRTATGRRMAGGKVTGKQVVLTPQTIRLAMTDSESETAEQFAQILAKAVAPIATDRWSSVRDLLRHLTLT